MKDEEEDSLRRVLVVGSLARADGMRPFCVNNMPFSLFSLSFFFFTRLRGNTDTFIYIYILVDGPTRRNPCCLGPPFHCSTKLKRLRRGFFYDPLRAVFDVP